MSAQPPATNSLITFRNSQGDDARGTLLKLTRSTVIFEVYNPYSILQLSEVISELCIRRNEHIIYEGRAVVSNLVNTGLMLVVSATLIDPWSDLSDFLDNSHKLRNEVTGFVTQWENSNDLNPEYRLAVSRIRSFLGELNQWLEQIEVLARKDSKNNNDILPQEQFEELTIPVLGLLGKLFTRFEEAAEKITAEELYYHKSFTQRDLHPLMLKAPFLYRAYRKPLGYAGDYEMVNMMLNNKREGATTYTQLINNLYLQLAPAQAHRNRIRILINYLKSVARNDRKRLRILNIGCGPAKEIQEFIHHFPESGRYDFTLIDFNEETILYTENKIAEAIDKSGNKPDINFILMSVHSLLKNASRNQSDLGGYDFVYCAGLFDYLSDKVCLKLVNLFYEYLVPGGKLLVTNVHSDNPNRWTMEHIAEWYLIYRDENGMKKIARDYRHNRVFVDETGINIFLEISRHE